MSEFGEIIDTTTIEEPRVEWLGPKQQILTGLVLGILVFYKIYTTGAAFVDAPRWSIFDSVFGNSLFSGLIGPIENLTFFGIIFSTVLAVCRERTGNEYLSFIVALTVATAIFAGYHTFRYSSSESAMLSVIIFGALNCILVYVTRSLIISDIIHFTNNFLIGYGIGTSVGFGLIL